MRWRDEGGKCGEIPKGYVCASADTSLDVSTGGIDCKRAKRVK